MPLNPRAGRFGLAGAWRPGFGDLATAAQRKAHTDAHPSVVGLREQRAKIEGEIRSGKLTPSVGREKLAEMAGRYRAEMEAERRQPPPDHPLFSRLRAVADERKQAEQTGDIATALRELVKTNRQLLVEHQLDSRRAEFLGKTTPTTMPAGLGGYSPPARPTVESLVAFKSYAERADDPAAVEFARRELAAMRPTADEARAAKIDEALARQDLVTPSRVDSVLSDLEKIHDPAHGLDAATRSRLVARLAEDAIKAGDANTLVALYVDARGYPADQPPPWYSVVSQALEAAPPDALRALREWEANRAAAAEQEAQTIVADAGAAMLDDAELRGVEAPTTEQLRQRALGEQRTAAIRRGEPVGLSITARSPASTNERAAQLGAMTPAAIPEARPRPA